MNRKNSEIGEQIAQLIASLPSDDLRQQAKTTAQIEEWDKARTTQLLLAKCWRAKWLVKDYYPVEEALEKKEISQRKAKLIDQQVNEYKARWELCQVAEKYVKKLHTYLQKLTGYVDHFPKPLVHYWYKFFHQVSLKQYPFQSAYDLFAETLKEDVNGSFSVCLEPYYEVPMKKWKQVAKQYTEILEQSELDGFYPKLRNAEEQKLKRNLVWDKVGFSWIGMVLLVCQSEAKNDSQLRKKLLAYNDSLHEALSLAVTASRELHGWAWHKGDLLDANGAGGVYRKP
ncbi:hypothetical protein Osc7112_6787 (plasmid) [Oscillatoria nigro-viridis PCC 7112]|uniref:Uncharacterized protein n=1 Tax=Phormidium nigroviride PCC 7112 TaxID=179408 RepID=K9VUJ6_9CYAN|nr:hypothetical protein [Oscillatoria nigro-viridis]AFZ10875.1 hypothetical protein Osc7112_6787 [Oscillatoria nigro-viridis PCC 7112]